MNYYLGLDIGSSSIKAALVEISTGKSLGVVQEPKQEMGMFAQKNGWAEQKPNDWWLHSCNAIKHLKKQHNISRTQIKGIGRWTAEMFLIFNLCRADIFPLDDIGMIRGLCKLYNIPYPTNRELVIKIGEKWKPYRSVATWYLWRSLDPIPVEY